MTLAQIARQSLVSGDKTYDYLALSAVEEASGVQLSRLPYCLRVLLENVLRNVGRNDVSDGDVRQLAAWSPTRDGHHPGICDERSSI